MGDGKKLKEYIDKNGTNVRKIAKETGISATTLYTIIQRDSNIRLDFALRLANALDIEVNEICSGSPPDVGRLLKAFYQLSDNERSEEIISTWCEECMKVAKENWCSSQVAMLERLFNAVGTGRSYDY